jgi:hypothetical protein
MKDYFGNAACDEMDTLEGQWNDRPDLRDAKNQVEKKFTFDPFNENNDTRSELYITIFFNSLVPQV